ncbi:MAG TPA: TrkA C-terminal domain-containing protein [Clostridia bacterium]|nr:TrkA C-terminal domain-containing protein [Clostridia bacterium]
MGPAVSKYQEIAADFAEKLVEGAYKVGDRIYARSSLASTYGVSAETARRAVKLLADLGVLEVTGGSGVVVLSVEKAVEFLRRFKGSATASQMKQQLKAIIQRQKDELDRFSSQIDSLADQAEKLHALNPFAPFRVVIPADSSLVGRTLTQTNFWQKTGATVVAIGYGEDVELSPGPNAVLKAGCTVYYIGKIECIERVHAFLAKG